MNNLSLHIPKYEELSYRENLLSQKETMSYNASYNLDNRYYHKDTGCLDFPKKEWESWYKRWVNNLPNNYYAYIVKNNKFIGEVNLYYNIEKDWYEMGIVIENNYRGNDYSKKALKLLLNIAFEKYNAKAVHNMFEVDRIAALKLHKDLGFIIISEYDDLIELLLSKEEYFRNNKKEE